MGAGRAVFALLTGMLLAACSAVPSSSPDRASYVYVVERGDSLARIAGRLGIDAATLASRNGLKAPYTIHPGQRLSLPPGGSYATAPRPGRLPAPSAQTQRVTEPRKDQTTRPAPSAVAPTAGSAASSPPPVARPLASQQRELGAPALAWPADAPITSRFGATSDGRINDGLDLVVLPGQRIHAAASGTVLFAGLEPMYGQLVIVDHGGGWATAYGFVGQITVKEGDPVVRRERIGVNGAKNRKLHFQLRRENRPQDPQVYLPPRL